MVLLFPKSEIQGVKCKKWERKTKRPLRDTVNKMNLGYQRAIMKKKEQKENSRPLSLAMCRKSLIIRINKKKK